VTSVKRRASSCSTEAGQRRVTTMTGSFTAILQ
jgi:hypothetical protein